MNHFAFSIMDLLTFLVYALWILFVIGFLVWLVRVMRAIEDIGRSLRVMAYDLREISDELKALRDDRAREQNQKEEPS